MLADVGHDPARQVFAGRKDAAMDQVALDLGEPQLDLIEPRGVGRCGVKVNVGALFEEVADALPLMRRKIVEDDVDPCSNASSRAAAPCGSNSKSVLPSLASAHRACAPCVACRALPAARSQTAFSTC